MLARQFSHIDVSSALLRDGKVNSSSSKLLFFSSYSSYLTANLPGSSESVHFEQKITNINNDQGFISLGASWQELVDALELLQEDKNVREYLSEEINSALMIKAEYFTASGIGQWEELNQTRYNKQQELEQLLRKIRDGLSAPDMQILSLNVCA